MPDLLFLRILNMSLTGGLAVLLVLLARILLRKAPKKYVYPLWGLILLRLCCPLSLESILSLVPSTEVFPTELLTSTNQSDWRIQSGFTAIDQAVNPVLLESSPSAVSSCLSVLSWIWLTGVTGMLLYSLISLLGLRQKLVGRVRLRENIYLADHIASPFVLGVLRPKIYLPSSLDEKEQQYILLHEDAHIRRLDPIFRAVSFAALSIHWFNPLVWAAFWLSGRDMEMACDESVMGRLDADIHQAYAQTLLHFAAGPRHILAAPLAFGESGTKVRIKNILRYHKPRWWMIAAAAIVLAVLCVGLLTSPAHANRQAQRFEAYFTQHWQQIEGAEEGMSQPRGTVFWADLDENGVPELYLTYSTSTGRQTGLLAYDLSGEEPVQLGQGYLGFSWDENTRLRLGKNSGGPVLILTGETPAGAANPDRFYEEICLTYLDGAYSLDALAYSQNQDTQLYTDLATGQAFSPAEFDSWKQQRFLLESTSLVLAVEKPIDYFEKEGELAKEISRQLRRWESSHPAAKSVGGAPLAPHENQNTTAVLTFPAYQEGRTEYNGPVYEIAPFTLRMDLPAGWTAALPPAEERDESAAGFTPVYLMADGQVKAVVSYNVFALYEEEIPLEDFYKTVYPFLRLGSLYWWDTYTPIVSSQTAETALATVFYKEPVEGQDAAAWPETSVPGILSYDKERLIYIAIQFSDDSLPLEDLRTMAKSVSIGE